MIRLKSPVHPGEFLKAEVVEAHDLSITDAAAVLRVTRQALSTVLNGRSSHTPDMALRFEKAFGVSMDTLLRMQTSYDIAQARGRADRIDVERYSGPKQAA